MLRLWNLGLSKCNFVFLHLVLHSIRNAVLLRNDRTFEKSGKLSDAQWPLKCSAWFTRLSRCRCSSSYVRHCNACSQGALHWRFDACQATCSELVWQSNPWEHPKKTERNWRNIERPAISMFQSMKKNAEFPRNFRLCQRHVKLQVAPGACGQWVRYLCPSIGPDAWHIGRSGGLTYQYSIPSGKLT